MTKSECDNNNQYLYSNNKCQFVVYMKKFDTLLKKIVYELIYQPLDGELVVNLVGKPRQAPRGTCGGCTSYQVLKTLCKKPS